MRNPENCEIFEKYAYFWRKILKNWYPFWPKSPLKMGMGFEARAAHPCPTQIWVPPTPPGLHRLWSSSAAACIIWSRAYWGGQRSEVSDSFRLAFIGLIIGWKPWREWFKFIECRGVPRPFSGGGGCRVKHCRWAISVPTIKWSKINKCIKGGGLGYF